MIKACLATNSFLGQYLTLGFHSLTCYSERILIIRPLRIFNPYPLVILNEFRSRFGDYFRFIFFFLIIKRYNLVVPKDFSAKSNFHIQISFPQVSASTLISNGFIISNQTTNITTSKYFSLAIQL